MTVPAYSASARWYREGHFGYCVRTMKSPGGSLDLPKIERPAGDMSRSAVPDLVLCQDVLGGGRMFKQSVGVPPRVYLTRGRLEKACELLEMTDLPVTEIAHEVGYSSNQVLARLFIKHQRMSPSDYRRAVRGPVRPSISLRARSALEARQ
jgi:hypothetical protein